MTGKDIGSWQGYLSALRQRREEFRSLGCTATDHGHPTAAIKFQSDQPRQSAQLQQVELKPGMLVITGRSNDALPPPPQAAP